MRANPQVTDASASLSVPLTGGPVSPYGVGGRPRCLPCGCSVRSLVFTSSRKNYFTLLLHIPLHEGRAFNAAQDRDGAPLVCILNETLAKRLFPGESAIGKIMLRGREADVKSEVVGVIDDVEDRRPQRAPSPDEIYYPMRQLGKPGMAVLARTDGDPNALQPIIRSAVAAVDKNQPISFFQTMETGVAQSLGVQRIVAQLTGVFAVLALVLAAVGLYSVLAASTQCHPAHGWGRDPHGARRPAQPGDFADD